MKKKPLKINTKMITKILKQTYKGISNMIIVCVESRSCIYTCVRDSPVIYNYIL